MTMDNQDNNDNMEQYYRRRAPEYEQIYYRDNPVRRGELKDEAQRLAELVRGKKVLELACGTGYWTEIMSQSAASITASDLAPEMLVEAQKKEFGCPVSFVQANMFEQPFGKSCYDIVAVGFWFSHQPKQEYDAYFDAIEKPLRPGGRIWMIDNNPAAEGGLPITCHVDEQGNNYKERSLSNGDTYRVLKNYFERADLEAIFGSRFSLESLIHQKYYWSTVLAATGSPG